jgi:hypothetical protein
MPLTWPSKCKSAQKRLLLLGTVPGKMLVVGSLGIFLLLLHLFEER